MLITKQIAEIKTMSGLLKLIKHSKIHDITTLRPNSLYQIQLGTKASNLFIQVEINYSGKTKINITERTDISVMGGNRYSLGKTVELMLNNMGRDSFINSINPK